MGLNWGGGLLQPDGKITPCCPSPALLFVPVIMADTVLPSLLCDDDGPDMCDIADAESISDGDAADLLDVEEDVDGVADAVQCVQF